MQRILLAWDGRGHAEAAGQWVRRKLLENESAEVVVLYVTVLVGSPRFSAPRWSSEYDQELVDTVRVHLEHDVFRGLANRVHFLHESGMSVSAVIATVAEVLRCETVVLGGCPPRGLRRWMGGGVGAEVLRKTDASVVVIRSTRAPIPLHGPHQAG